ncbi:MAG: nickel pincer cofactor biosynthesis protein LarC [Chloroflexota bacterium]|nr:nickel pincer cofactor biosynthesis protein LarC [Dehalococcoidia bacterium]MDW8253247.1 nickel pincer cofactor biosynthesis protein LarC [Chloroflexota bacterium]
MRAAYFDVFAGASGDMLLGALIDAGASAAEITAALRTLPLEGWGLDVRPEHRGVIGGTRVEVWVDPALSQPQRRLADIVAAVEQSQLPSRVKRDAAAVFRALAEAEGRVHRQRLDDVHFHEVGAVDSIVDIVGAVVALELLGIEQVFVSSVPLGGGIAQTAHGKIPAPAPATLELLARAGAPVRPSFGAAATTEMVTPTAAAFFAALGVFEQPALRLTTVGYGLGARRLPDLPNALRVLIGERDEPSAPLLLLETNIDDQPAEQLGYVLERLFAVGVRDAWFTPIQMKKSRPAVMMSVIAEAAQEREIADLLLRETSTLGVRVIPIRRHEAERVVKTVETRLGPARVKVKRLEGRPVAAVPEFEDCRRLALEHGLPIAEVYRLVESAARGAMD